jgi:hypothetical protein
MNIENILNNDEYKLIFLKAILLGINYGQSNNIEYYKENIQHEILKIHEKKKIIVEKTNLAKNSIIDKFENIIDKLDQQKNYTLNLINNLSTNNYGYNYSRINLLRTNLSLINREIAKNKLILKKNKDLIEKEIKNAKDKELLNPIKSNKDFKFSKDDISKKNENFVGELEKTLGSLSSLLIN